MTVAIPEFRARTVIPDEELQSKVGKILTHDDYNLLASGPVRIFKPNGKPLLVYLPDIIPQELRDQSYPDLHKIRGTTNNRGLASGSRRVGPKEPGKRAAAMPVMSSIIGYFDATAPYFHCRLTAYTAKETEGWDKVQPLFKYIADKFAEMVPERYQAQMDVVNQTQPDWVIPGTPFTTITINNTYPTGVHTDKGDLDEGFSCLATLRRGDYTGGMLTFPEYRVAVDMKDGDLLLMDAHEWHGNVAMEKHSEDAERISIVCYYRTGMQACGTFDEELAKAGELSDYRSGVGPKPEFMSKKKS